MNSNSVTSTSGSPGVSVSVISSAGGGHGQGHGHLPPPGSSSPGGGGHGSGSTSTTHSHHHHVDHSHPTTPTHLSTYQYIPHGPGPSYISNNTGLAMTMTSSGLKGQYVPRGGAGRYVAGRMGGEVKVKRKCVEVACQPSLLFLIATVCCTAMASVLLGYSLTGEYWEMLNYDGDEVNRLVQQNSSNNYLSVEWMFEGKVPVIRKGPTTQKKKDSKEKSYKRQNLNLNLNLNLQQSDPNSQNQQQQYYYLLPLHSGVWISCIDLEEKEFNELLELGYPKQNRCVDHLDPDVPKPTEARASWQHRMQNLAIACAIVCLILQGAAIFVGFFGVLRPQISAVLVTGVIYVLSATFAIFTLIIVHFKHKHRNDSEPLDVWTRLLPQLGDNEFTTARLITHGGSLVLAWAGSGVCILASVMWILLSKMMRYNPISIFT